MIHSFSLRRLRNGEFITFIRLFLKIVNGSSLPVALVSALALLENLTVAMESAHVANGGSELTDEARQIDEARDMQVSGLRHLARAFATHINPEKAAAGKRFLNRLNDYGTLEEFTKQGDADETADINSFLDDVRTGSALSEAATLIGAGDWLDPLKRLNERFEELTLELNKERVQKAGDSVDKLRIKAYPAYATVVRKINSFYENEDAGEPWAGIIAAVNAHIKKTRDGLAARNGRRSDKDAG